MSSFSDLQTGQAVTITWLDSRARTGWYKDKPPDPSRIKTVGIVVTHDSDSLVLTTSMSDSGYALDPVSIPWGCVTNIWRHPSE